MLVTPGGTTNEPSRTNVANFGPENQADADRLVTCVWRAATSVTAVESCESSVQRFETTLFHSAEDNTDPEDAVPTGTIAVYAAYAAESAATVENNPIPKTIDLRNSARGVFRIRLTVTEICKNSVYILINALRESRISARAKRCRPPIPLRVSQNIPPDAITEPRKREAPFPSRRWRNVTTCLK